MGTGIGHYIPLVCYLGCWVMCLMALFGKPLYAFYYMLPLLPYRTMRDHFYFDNYPLGGLVLTVLVVCIVVGALIHGKRPPSSKLYIIWLGFGLYLYLSMWIGTLLGNAPAPLTGDDLNFATWKAYMVIPLIFLAAGMVIEDRKAIRMTIIIVALSVLLVDKGALQSSLSHTFTHFNEDKRDGGPLGFAGSNGLAAFLAQFAMFFWGFVQYIKRKKAKLLFYGLVGITMFATMYTFSRASYIALVLGAFLLGFLKDRKLIVIAAIFLFTWQTIVPTAVTERVTMTESSNGKLEESAQERVNLWEDAKNTILSSPIVGTGYATFQMGTHTGNLKDTHNWFVKVQTETGIIGMIIVLVMLQQMLATSYRLFKHGVDPLYRGLGLGLLLATFSSIILNCFGDRWTYIEITGLLWALFGAAARALELPATEVAEEAKVIDLQAAANPYLAYR